MKVIRFYMDPIVDYDIHGVSPVQNVPVFKAGYGLNMERT
jgi:hypothetical protein